jgi:putative methyltransferase (TIGR04325 family)
MREKIEKIPLVKHFYRHWLQRQFQTNGYGSFWGVYKTFEEAVQAAPKNKNVGYNDPALAQEYQQMLLNENWENSGRFIAGHDYPLIFWLSEIFEQEKVQSVFDFGGNVGIHFYSYAKYLKYPPDLRWIICEVPEIANIGRELAGRREASNLSFTCDYRVVNNQDVFIGSGSIQYVENLSQMLTSSQKPRHLLINRLPLYNGDQFVTLQNGGKVFYPQYVFNKNIFIKGLETIGYELVDFWENQGDSCIIPFHLDKSVKCYAGLYFKLKNNNHECF